jgi:hypothetical protein
MAIQLTDLYLYLGRRDKKGVRILAKLRSRPQIAVRLDNLEDLQLPTIWETQIEQIIYDARMLWEPWMESANTFDELRSNLKVRGYTNIPITSQPEFQSNSTQALTINPSYIPVKTTMLRKGG